MSDASDTAPCLLPPVDAESRCTACGVVVKRDAYCPCVKEKR